VGGAGTLSISAIITAVMKRLPVERCGYSGLMLPVTEDAGLAERNNEGRLSIQQLLFYSSVCGTGIDTVPIEGHTSPERLALVYLDMASLAFRLRKPLSARLWPVAGKSVGDMTEVDNAFFVNTKVMSIDPEPAKPEAAAVEVAGVNGEVTVLSDSPEALVVRLGAGTDGLALVMHNSGSKRWPAELVLRSDGGHVQEVPAAQAGEAVTLGLVFDADGQWLQREPVPDQKACWEYYVGDGVPGWYPFEDKASEEVESIYAQHEASGVISSGYYSYRVDMTNLKQENTRSGNVRDIRRVFKSIDLGAALKPARKAPASRFRLVASGAEFGPAIIVIA